jgi:alpha-tubulin suppressor-like RCC1 family protein
VGNNDSGQCNVSSWTDIVAIAADYHHTVGLKSDGTVVAVGDNNDVQVNVSNLTFQYPKIWSFRKNLRTVKNKIKFRWRRWF